MLKYQKLYIILPSESIVINLIVPNPKIWMKYEAISPFKT